jgi:RNA-directed DNA polymerase
MRLSTPENLRRLQRKLYVKSKQEPGYRFYSLYDKIWRKDVLEHAWQLVRAHRGAAGIDRMTIEKAEERIDELLVELQEELRLKRYRPQAVRRVYIPKPRRTPEATRYSCRARSDRAGCCEARVGTHYGSTV